MFEEFFIILFNDSEFIFLVVILRFYLLDIIFFYFNFKIGSYLIFIFNWNVN